MIAILTTAVLLGGMMSMPAQAPRAAKRVGLVDYLRGAYGGIKNDLTAAADALAGADYGFRPSAMPDVRTFAQTIMHVASAQSSACARLLGRPDPAGAGEAAAESKADVVKALAASFAVCDEVFASLTEENAAAGVSQLGFEIPKSAAVAGLIAHDAEMYGIATVYLRAKNIVPPSTARQKGNR
jgi:hypothetical protein